MSKRIRSYTPRHNGRVERSYQENQKCFCEDLEGRHGSLHLNTGLL